MENPVGFLHSWGRAAYGEATLKIIEDICRLPSSKAARLLPFKIITFIAR